MSNPIGWCDITINPFVGCSKCSPGCENCYAERFAARLAKNRKTTEKYAGVVDENGKWTGAVRYFFFWHEKLPKTPKRIFLNSMSDFFHPAVKEDDIHEILDRISDDTKQHTFLLLTKRPERMTAVLSYRALPPNLWLGVTVCNQEEADAKIPVLLQIPAAKLFVSIEPMLGPVDVSKWVFDRDNEISHLVNGPACLNFDQADSIVAQSLHWVICGGETGPGARPIHLNWVRGLRDQCVDAGVPFYFKGWGGSGKKSASLLDSREWHQFPEVSNA